MVSLTIQVSEEDLERARLLAARTQRSVSEVASELMAAALDEQAYQAAIDEGLAEADAGELLDADEVFSALRAKLNALRSGDGVAAEDHPKGSRRP